MARPTLWERVKFHFKNDYIEIEEWTVEMDKKEEKEFLKKLVAHLESCHPNIKVVSVRWTYCELRSTGHPLFEGHSLKLTPNVDLKELKRSCIEFERDGTGKRIADLDVFYGGRKVSRHDPLYNYFIS